MCYFTDELIVNIAVSITDADLLLGWYASDYFSGDIIINFTASADISLQQRLCKTVWP